jgi:hypothetical protein
MTETKQNTVTQPSNWFRKIVTGGSHKYCMNNKVLFYNGASVTFADMDERPMTTGCDTARSTASGTCHVSIS